MQATGVARRVVPCYYEPSSVLADYIHAGVFASYVINEYGSDQVNRLHCLTGSKALLLKFAYTVHSRESRYMRTDADAVSTVLELLCVLQTMWPQTKRITKSYIVHINNNRC